MYRLQEDVEVQGVYNELMDMTAEEARTEMISRIRMMTSGERAEFAVELYEMDLVDRKYARELLGISEEEYLQRTMFGAWYTALEERFESLSDEFLSSKYMEMVKEYGD